MYASVLLPLGTASVTRVRSRLPARRPAPPARLEDLPFREHPRDHVSVLVQLRAGQASAASQLRATIVPLTWAGSQSPSTSAGMCSFARLGAKGCRGRTGERLTRPSCRCPSSPSASAARRPSDRRWVIHGQPPALDAAPLAAGPCLWLRKGCRDGASPKASWRRWGTEDEAPSVTGVPGPAMIACP